GRVTLRPMGAVTSNFQFLEAHDVRLARLGALAERYFADDPPAALIKLRQLGEFLAKDIAASHALLPSTEVSFDDVLRTLRSKAILPREVADMFYHLKRVGNAAAHEDRGSAGDALQALKLARSAAVWFLRTFGQPNFKPGPFVPPTPPVDATAALMEELADLKAVVARSEDAEAKARLLAQEVEQREQERAFWEQYASETEAQLRSAEQALAQTQATASAASPQQLDLLAALGARNAQDIELDEATTRVLIDEQLRSAGWQVDSTLLRHAAGARPQCAEAVAIAEWPTKSGPVDYALFVDGRCVAVIEAKRQVRDVPGRIGQAKRYARDIELTPDELPEGGPWIDGEDRFRVPFLFATNGRPYVKQLATKSGIWFWDARSGAPPRALAEWFSPRDLVERLEQETVEDLDKAAEREIGVTGLRPYQREAIQAVED